MYPGVMGVNLAGIQKSAFWNVMEFRVVKMVVVEIEFTTRVGQWDEREEKSRW
jgi:hypothetical protein